MTIQYTLPVDHYVEQTLDNFVEGRNSELIKHLSGLGDIFKGFWIYGQKSSGRSHLLRAKCNTDSKALLRDVHYVGCKELPLSGRDRFSALKTAVKFGRTIAIDDIGFGIGDREFELHLFEIYQRLNEENGTLLISHHTSALMLNFAIADLGSRVRALMNFELKELNDSHKSVFLIQRAKARGFRLPQIVIKYWLSHGPRDMEMLVNDFETLAEVMLRRKHVLTIPLFKEVLGY